MKSVKLKIDKIMSNEKYNLDKLVKIKVNPSWRSKSVYYKEAKPKRYFWQKEVKKGYYTLFFDEQFLGETLKNHTLVDEVVYELPEVVMTFEGGVSKTIYFNTMVEARTYFNNLTNGTKLAYL